MRRKLFTAGLTGSVVAAVCCFTPLLVTGLSVAGLSAAIPWLDYVLLPALGFFVILTVYALFSGKRS